MFITPFRSNAGVNLDKLGATASTICAIHCAAMPAILGVLTLIGLRFLADERVEWMLLACSAAIGVSSLCFGYREHRRKRALCVLSVGLTLLVRGRLLEARNNWEAILMVVCGGLMVALSHIINSRLRSAYASCALCEESH